MIESVNRPFSFSGSTKLLASKYIFCFFVKRDANAPAFLPDFAATAAPEADEGPSTKCHSSNESRRCCEATVTPPSKKQRRPQQQKETHGAIKNEGLEAQNTHFGPIA